jgi:hypothetical protein
MNTQQIAATYNTAETLADTVTTFWANSVGKNINTLEQFSLLVEWHDAIKQAQNLAITLRDWVGVGIFDSMLSECELWLDHISKS